MWHTWVAEVVLSIGQDLKRAGEVKGIDVVVEGKEDIDGFVVVTTIRYCTHLAGSRGVYLLREYLGCGLRNVKRVLNRSDSPWGSGLMGLGVGLAPRGGKAASPYACVQRETPQPTYCGGTLCRAIVLQDSSFTHDRTIATRSEQEVS